MIKFNPPPIVNETLLANSNVELIFTFPTSYGYDDMDNYIPIANSNQTYKAICHADNKPLEDAFYGTDNKGEWLRGRLTKPLQFSFNVVHLSNVIVKFLAGNITRDGVLYLPTPNPYTPSKIGQTFNILISTVDK